MYNVTLLDTKRSGGQSSYFRGLLFIRSTSGWAILLKGALNMGKATINVHIFYEKRHMGKRDAYALSVTQFSKPQSPYRGVFSYLRGRGRN